MGCQQEALSYEPYLLQRAFLDLPLRTSLLPVNPDDANPNYAAPLEFSLLRGDEADRDTVRLAFRK